MREDESQRCEDIHLLDWRNLLANGIRRSEDSGRKETDTSLRRSVFKDLGWAVSVLEELVVSFFLSVREVLTETVRTPFLFRSL